MIFVSADENRPTKRAATVLHVKAFGKYKTSSVGCTMEGLLVADHV
jgi:hypothetical protein